MLLIRKFVPAMQARSNKRTTEKASANWRGANCTSKRLGRLLVVVLSVIFGAFIATEIPKKFGQNLVHIDFQKAKAKNQQISANNNGRDEFVSIASVRGAQHVQNPNIANHEW